MNTASRLVVVVAAGFEPYHARLLAGIRPVLARAGLVNEGTITEAELCPSCGSGQLVLQGRMFDGKIIRELVCVLCKHAWRIELPEFHRRLRP